MNALPKIEFWFDFASTYSYPAAVLATARGNEAKSCLRRNTERAVELGIFGAPMTVVGQELFWGNDRLEAALAWQRAGRD